jgi:hypothetical protein
MVERRMILGISYLTGDPQAHVRAPMLEAKKGMRSENDPKKLLTGTVVGYRLIVAIHIGQVAQCSRVCPSAISSIKSLLKASFDVLVA